MKKYLILSFVVAATMTAISCSKESVNNPVDNGRVSFTFAAPSILDEAEDPATRVDITNASGNNMVTGTDRPTFRWQKGDKITVLSYSVPDGCTSSDATEAKAAWATSEYTIWGQYTAASTANSTKFNGYLPASFQTDAYLILHSSVNDSFDVVLEKGAVGRYNIKYNIPDVQDGTGLKYCLFGARPVYDVTNKKFSFAAINNVTTGNANSSAYNNQFSLRSALTSFSVPADAHITEITITLTTSNGTALTMVSDGDAKDIQCNSLNFAHSLGSKNVLTIKKDGEELSGTIFFASRQIEGKSGTYYPILTFQFKNASGKTATRVIKLAKPINSETSFTLKNINVAKLNKLGAFTFNDSDFQ